MDRQKQLELAKQILQSNGTSTANSTGEPSLQQKYAKAFASVPVPVEKTKDQIAKEKMQKDTRNAANFIGIAPIAEGVGQAIAQPKIEKQTEQVQGQANDIQTQLLLKIKEKKLKGEDTSRLEGALHDLGGNLQEIGDTTGQLLNQNDLSIKEVLGSAAQTAANFIPLEKTANLATKGATKLGAGKALAKVAGKVVAGAGTGYALDVGTGLQNENKTTAESLKPGVGTIVGASLPVAGLLARKLIVEPLGRISKGIASGLSGTSANTLDEIINNPEKAKEISSTLATKGSDVVLQDQVNQYMSGVSKIRKEASTAFGEGVEKLAETDIKPTVFRSNVQNFLENNGISLENGQRSFGNVEFSDPSNIQKASSLIDKLHSAELNGKSLRKLVDEISNSAYKTATTDERISYNLFVKDLASAVRTAITDSTDKLGEINAQYSKDIGLADAIQNIYGDVKFKNAEEINKIAKKIEKQNLTGLDEKTVNDFFDRIGKSSKDFKTTSATREISNKALQRNPEGLNVSEIVRSITAGVITPKLVRDISVLVGKTQPEIKKILNSSGSELAKKALLNSLANLRKQ